MTTQMVSRPPGLWRDAKHKYYYGTVGPLPSVTTITGVVDKSGPLVAWAKRETAACAVRNIDMLASMVKTGGKEPAAQWLSGIPDYQRDTAADLGTTIHAMADALQRGEEISPTGVEVPYVRAYRDFLAAVKPEIVYSERMIANLALGFGGTFDIGCLIDGVWTLLDIKTGKAVYEETALQLAGYAMAEFTATPDDPTQVPLPKWERFGVIHLQPDNWNLIPFDVTSATEDAFVAALRLTTWRRETAPFTKGTPIQIAPSTPTI